MTYLKLVHITCAYITGLGFFLRGTLAVLDHPLGKHRALKILPHAVDTLLLVAALAMLTIWSVSPLTTPWLAAKITALLLYITCGLTMLRWGSTPGRRWLGFIGGLLCYGYIVAVAHSKTPWPWPP